MGVDGFGSVRSSGLMLLLCAARFAVFLSEAENDMESFNHTHTMNGPPNVVLSKPRSNRRLYRLLIANDRKNIPQWVKQLQDLPGPTRSNNDDDVTAPSQSPRGQSSTGVLTLDSTPIVDFPIDMSRRTTETTPDPQASARGLRPTDSGSESQAPTEYLRKCFRSVRRRVLAFPGCKRTMVDVGGCEGGCESRLQPIGPNVTLASDGRLEFRFSESGRCRCCHAKRFRMRQVALSCRQDNVWTDRTVRVTVVTGCHCRRCVPTSSNYPITCVEPAERT